MNTKPILLVEDNPDDVKLTLNAFQSCGIANAVVVAKDGAKALELLSEEGGGGYAIVLLDLKLPKLDGLEVLQRIRGNERTRLLPVVVLTSSREDEDMLASYELGANSYIRKPVDFDQFLEAARQLGMYWLLLNEPPPERARPSTAASS